ncbi:type VII secretion protein EccB [Corynebacterium kroppenstedtii]|uniref:type VII secretion protein EccB n=1 Tax=Corynebacterium sp. PCR 32 TaxID=3351342 RepID=UPI0030B374CE
MPRPDRDDPTYDQHQERSTWGRGGGKDHQQPTSSAQLAGYRFVRKQLEQALVFADARMVHDVPGGRRRALAVGVVLSVLGIAGAGVMAMIRPDPGVGDHTILISSDTGQMFVRVNDTLHPVTDLASARLVAGKPEEAHRVSSKNVEALSRGEFIGLRGPSDLPPKGDATSTEDSWGVCHSPDSPRQRKASARSRGVPTMATVADGAAHGGSGERESSAGAGHNSRGTLSVAVARAMPREARSAVLRAESGLWLVSPDSSEGHPFRRSLLAKRGSTPEPAVARALGMSSSVIRDVPDSFVEAIPRVDDVRTIRASMPASGDSGLRKPFNTVGTVIIARQDGSSYQRHATVPDRRGPSDRRASETAGAAKHDDDAADAGDVYVVREHGIAPLAPVHAHLLLSRPGVVVERVSPADMSDIPTADELNWGTIPAERPQWAPADGQLCAGTLGMRPHQHRPAEPDAASREAGGDADVLTWSEARTISRHPVPVVATGQAVAVGKKDKEKLGPRTADFYAGPGHAVAVDTGSGYAIVSSDGRRFAVDSQKTLEILGFRSPTAAPWSVVRHLAEGEELSRDRASKIIVGGERS